MVKNVWVQPQTVVQQFVANEYVAACGDSGTIYKFECNAGQENHDYSVYTLNRWGQKEYLTYGSGFFGKHTVDGYSTSYHPCGETHTAASDSGFLTGYYIDDMDTRKDERIPVIVWTNRNTNVHCTTNLNMDNWETLKS